MAANKKKLNTAQEVQEATADNAAMIEAAAQIAGKPAAEITPLEAREILEKDAETNPLFQEIGSSERNPADPERAKRAMQAAADAIRAEDAREVQEARGKTALKEYLQQRFTPEQIEQAQQEEAAQRELERKLLSTEATRDATARSTAEAEILERMGELVSNTGKDSDRINYAMNAALEKQQRINAAFEPQMQIHETLQQAAQQMNQAVLDGLQPSINTAQEQMQAILDGALQALDVARGIANSEGFQTLLLSLQELQAWTQAHQKEIAAAAKAEKELIALEPFLKAELEARAAKDPAFKNISLDDLFEDMDDTGEPCSELWKEILKAARGRKARIDSKKATDKKASAAQKAGTSTEIKRLLVPTDPQFQNAFITSVSANIGLFRRVSDDGKRQLALDVNIPFLRAIAQRIADTFRITGNFAGETKIYIPDFVRELGLDINHRAKEAAQKAAEKGVEEKRADEEKPISRAESRQIFINNLIIDIDNIWGVLPGEPTEYKLASVHSYNPETEELSIVSPYLQRLVQRQEDKMQKQIEAKKHYVKKDRSELLHPDVANERNQAAVEMATRFLIGIHQRGTTPDAKQWQNKKIQFKDNKLITYRISCAGLLEDCPQIREKLKKQKTKSAQTQTLQRTFQAMYRILKKKTDLYSYYKDLEINELLPTMVTLKTEIKATHHGKNPDYTPPFTPIDIVYETAQEPTQEAQDDTQ